jgi:hypothetical protein
VTLTTNPYNRQLDLAPGIGQRSATFKFELFDGPTGRELGEVHPSREQPPTLSHDVSRTIKRTLAPLVLPPREAAAINPVRDRVRVSMLLNGVTWPLGRYMFTDTVSLTSTGGDWSTSTLVDEMFLVDQKIEVAFVPQVQISSSSAIENVEISLERLLEDLPITLEAEQTPFSSATSWPSGTNRGQIIDELALTGDYFAPWFNNAGVLRFIRAFDPANQVPSFDWDANHVVLRDSIARTSDLLVAANRIVVVSNATSSVSSAGSPIVGTYNIPTSAPHSIFNRGFVIADVRTLAVDTSAQAAAIAANIGQRGTVFERVDLSTPPDPRHDSHDVVRWEGENWLELGWSMALLEGSEMRHTLRRVYR